MRQALMALLAGCGFSTKPATTEVDAMTMIDTSIDTPTVDGGALPAPVCATAAYLNNASVCPSSSGESITISVDTVLDTQTGTSTLQGLACAPLASGSVSVCALAASTITIAPGARLSAHGNKPLVLVGHMIDIQGTIDVASHAEIPSVPAVQGAASDVPGCNTLTANMRATGDGGGQGGTLSGTPGGSGGGGTNSMTDKGGEVMGSINLIVLRGGCPGGAPSGLGQQAIGGHGGGAVWLAADPEGTISLGDNATINASGAGGRGGLLGANRGGLGGGSGGMILLKAGTLHFAPSAKIFADGGGGGGGAAALQGGQGGDPIVPGIGGTAGVSGAGGGGGGGFPAPIRTGAIATGGTNGGGGGGGGAGTIWMDYQTQVGTATVSPLAARRP